MDKDTFKLRSELVSMLDALHRKVEKLEDRISNLEGNKSSVSVNSKLESSNNDTTQALSPESEKSYSITPKTDLPATAAAKQTNKPYTTLSNNVVDTTKVKTNEQPTPAVTPASTQATATPKVSIPEPPAANRANPFTAVIELLIMILGPFGSVFHQVIKVYNNYKKQGRGPAFLMTAAGILALVMGFGFLLQYSFSNYLGISGKIAVGFITAIGLVVIGMRISNKRTMLAEFGAALIGLGIILNYLCAYFISGHFNIVGPTIGLSLLAVITFASYWLAVHYDTKTVAVLSLLGGASTPLFLGDLTQISTIYFIYLTFLVATMLHLAQKIQWPNLIQFTLVISIAMTQYLFFDQGGNHLINNTLFIVLLNVLFYLFSFACLKIISQTEKEIDKTILLTLIANVVYFVFVLYQSINDDHYLGMIYIVNAIAVLVFYRFNWLINHANQVIKDHIKALLILQTGLLVGFGILFLVHPALLGLIWGIEGLALIYVGFRFTIPSVRYEGYFAFLFGMSSAFIESYWWVMSAFSYNYSGSVSLSYNTGWMNLIIFGPVLWLAARLLQRNIKACLAWEKIACYWSHEIFSIWLSMAFMLSLYVVMSEQLLLLSLIPLFTLLYRAKKYQLPISEFLGLAHYFLLVIQIFISAFHVNSFSFSKQDWVGIAVRIEAFVALWLIAEFYKRFYPDSKLAGFAHGLRITFYVLIPIMFIPKIIKSYDEFLPLALWLSTIIALGLFTRLKYQALKIEFYCLAAIAWLVTLFAMFADHINEWTVYSNSALFTGLAFFIATNFIWKAFSPDYQKLEDNNTALDKTKDLYNKIKDYVPLQQLSVYYLATTIFVIAYGLSENISFSILMCTLYFTVLCITWPKILPAKISLGISYGFILLLSFLSLITLNIAQTDRNANAFLPIFLLIQTGIIGFILHKEIRASIKIKKYFGGFISQLWTFNIFLIFSYTSSIYFWIPDQLRILLSILLVLHAAVILMQTLKQEFSGLLKLSIILFAGAAIKILMFDMADFSLIQKIIAFMVIGAMLLGASYIYQRVQQKVTTITRNIE